MKYKYLILFCLVLTIVTGCQETGNTGPQFYYMAIYDLADINSYNGGEIASEVIEAENAEDAANKAINKIMSHLYAEATVSFLPNALTKEKPHEFYVNIYDKDGNLVRPTSSEDLEKHVSRTAGIKNLWGREKKYKDALEYYRNNTNVFSNTIGVFAKGSDFSGLIEQNIDPVKKIKDAHPEAYRKRLSPFVIVILVIIFALSMFVLSRKAMRANRREHKASPTPFDSVEDFVKMKNPPIQMLNREGDPQEDEWHTYIAGVHHHVSAFSVGGFTGWVANDANNKYDSKAMGIYNDKGKLLGFIPASELAEYRDWCDAKPQPCVGFIYLDDGKIYGRVKILRPCNKDFISTEFGRYLSWVKSNYGPEYLPKSQGITFNIVELSETQNN